jgi:hypothetical protein
MIALLRGLSHIHHLQRNASNINACAKMPLDVESKDNHGLSANDEGLLLRYLLVLNDAEGGSWGATNRRPSMYFRAAKEIKFSSTYTVGQLTDAYTSMEERYKTMCEHHDLNFRHCWYRLWEKQTLMHGMTFYPATF